MSLTGSMYDNCSLVQRNRVSTSPFDFTTDNSVFESTKACVQSSSPFMRTPGQSIPSGLVELESQLRPYNRPLGNCIKDNYISKPKCTDCEKCSNSVPCDCLHCTVKKNHLGPDCDSDELYPKNTRSLKAKHATSEINQNRFEVLCENPQDDIKIPSNNIVGVSSRLFMRDAYDADIKRDPRLARKRNI